MPHPRIFFALACLGLLVSLSLGLALEPSLLVGPSRWPFLEMVEQGPAPAPQAQAQAEPNAEDQAWEELTRTLTTQVVSYRGRVGVYLKDLKNDRTWTYHADDLFPSASLIKVPIMASVFEKIRQGEVHLGSKVMLRRRDRVGGSGTLKWHPDGSKFTVRTVLEHMMAESDNTAMKMLIDVVGIGFLQEQFPKLGLVTTKIHPSGLSLNGSYVRQENYTTPREMGELLERMNKRELVDTFSSELMLDFMSRQKLRRRLAQDLPRGWEIAHKTGLLRRACHDVAVVSSPQGDFVIAVLTGQNRDYKRAKAFIAKVGRTVYTFYGGETTYARSLHRRDLARADKS